jgi:uncharacterized protein YciI
MKDIRCVILHAPGPKWQAGKDMFEQDGLSEHVDHYRKLQQAGKLALGGPFLGGADSSMMVPEAGLTFEEIEAFALADPTVVSGLLKAEVRQWLIGMSARR